MNLIKRLVAEETGNEAVEYAMILALVAAGIVSAVSLLGTQISASFKVGCGAITNKASC